ncbi:helix-turn-helix domain-containing protein, partial [Aliarcobacter cibarius]
MEIEKIDARKLSTDAQKEKRILAMRLRDKGMKNSEVAQIVGVNPGT